MSRRKISLQALRPNHSWFTELNVLIFIYLNRITLKSLKKQIRSSSSFIGSLLLTRTGIKSIFESMEENHLLYTLRLIRITFPLPFLFPQITQEVDRVMSQLENGTNFSPGGLFIMDRRCFIPVSYIYWDIYFIIWLWLNSY